MGGMFEEQGAEWYAQQKNKKPIISFIAGNNLTFRRHVGYAGDIITRGRITAEGKRKTMTDAGIILVDNINQIHEELKNILK
jgi:succinyl-CoA synthetase alpha subunit